MNEIMNSPLVFLLALSIYAILFALVGRFFILRQEEAKRKAAEAKEEEDYFRIVWVVNGRNGGYCEQPCYSPEEVKEVLEYVDDFSEVLVLKAESVYNYGKKVG